MLRFSSLKELKKHLSPDVEIVDFDPPTETKQEVTRQASQRKVLEDKFLFNWTALGGPVLVREHRFHSTRKWRLDFALPDLLIGFEIQGGLYSPESGHRSQAGVKRDMEKSNAAQRLGWQIYSLSSQNIQDAGYMEALISHIKERIEENHG